MAQNWNMTGHQWAVDMLRHQAAQGDMRHAYLFCGPPGLGRRTLALRFAQAVNCPTPSAPGEPCGACRDCRQIDAMQHPDLTIIEPTVKDPDDKDRLIPSPNGLIRIDQIRDVQKAINLKPYQARYRILIFKNFDKANDESSNALLKTLEEAPVRAILILTTENPEQLLPTIISRCEVLRLRPLPITDVEADLTQQGVDADRARLLAHISGGRPGFARRLLQDDSLLGEREEHLNDLQTLMRASRVEKFAYADRISKDKEAMRKALVFWLTCWRDVMMRVAGSESPLVNVDRAAEIGDLAGRLDLSTVRRVLTELEGALEKLDRNVNSRLLMEVLLLDLPKI